jgi:hypothetical protein
LGFWTCYKKLNIGFIKFNYFINQNGEVFLKEIKDVLKNNIDWFILKDLQMNICKLKRWDYKMRFYKCLNELKMNFIKEWNQ